MVVTWYRSILRSRNMRLGVWILASFIILMSAAPGALAGQSNTPTVAAAPAPAPQPTVDTGDTAWVLISAALVMLMTPGLAFFYGGLVRRKNILSVLMQCLMILCLISLQWVVFGYSLSFGPDKGSLIGSLDWAFLKGVGLTPNPDYAGTIPHQLFMMFQMMFAVITPALIVGAFAERMKFSALCVFMLLWATFVYDPVAHWVWGTGGFMKAWGALGLCRRHRRAHQRGHDRAGGGPGTGSQAGLPGRHVTAAQPAVCRAGGVPAVVRVVRLQCRQRLGANGLASNAFTVTHIAAAAAGVTWALLDWFKHRKPTTLGIITGMVAGLVSITPASGYVTPVGALAIGIGAGLIPWLSVTYLKTAFGYDDTLDAFGVHGVGGIWGAIATGIFATKSVNASGADGLLYGNPMLFWIQLKVTVITIVWSFVLGFVLLKLVDALMKLRVSEHDERVGLDLTQHREAAYTVID